MGNVYILREPTYGYFRGLVDDEDVVWTHEQRRALRFNDRGMAEFVMVGHCPSASVVRLVPKGGMNG